MNTEQMKQIEARLEEVKKEIAQKSAQDNAFRQALLSNPGETIEKEYNLPAGALKSLKINVVQEEQGAITLPIPAAVSQSGELSDEQLEAVAGGAAFIGAVGAIAGVVAAGAAVGTVVQNSSAGRSW